MQPSDPQMADSKTSVQHRAAFFLSIHADTFARMKDLIVERHPRAENHHVLRATAKTHQLPAPLMPTQAGD